MHQITDLREILRYVPRFRDRVFVIAMDGAVTEDDNFGNLLLDIALLRSLRIGVALVHGAGHQIRRLTAQTGRQLRRLQTGYVRNYALGIAGGAVYDALVAAAAAEHGITLATRDRRAADTYRVLDIDFELIS